MFLNNYNKANSVLQWRNIYKWIQSTVNTTMIQNTAVQIVKVLVAHKKPLMASELKEDLNKDWNTIRTNLSNLEREGRVHAKYIGGRLYYVLNGEGTHKDHIKMSDSEYLWLDVFEPAFNGKERFIRIKQTRRKNIAEWAPVGTVSIKKKDVDALILKLDKLKQQLD